MKKLFSAIFIIFITMAMCFNTVCVKATESSDIDRSKYEDYSGEIDLITGLPKEVAETEDVSTSDVVTLSRGVTYDGATGMYGYEISGGTFTCSAFDGMITTDAVKIAIESENDTSNIEVYRDGKKYDAIPEVIEDTGSYSVVTWNESSETQLLTFQIVGGVTGSINKYVMPDGFNVSKVYLDGKEIKSNRGMVDMTEEGRYEVDYRCVLSRVTYSLLVEVDHTPPVVSFDGIDAKSSGFAPLGATQHLSSEDLDQQFARVFGSTDNNEEDYSALTDEMEAVRAIAAATTDPVSDKVIPITDAQRSVREDDDAGEQARQNNKIMEMHEAGKSNIAIARELGLGVGEVGLVIELAQKNKRKRQI
jgi:hypothetical protein